MKLKITTYDPNKNKTVTAGMFEEGTFTKTVSDRHYMRKEHGYGIQESLIKHLHDLRCKKIIIKSKNNLWEFDFKEILNRPVRNYGHGAQRFLRVK